MICPVRVSYVEFQWDDMNDEVLMFFTVKNSANNSIAGGEFHGKLYFNYQGTWWKIGQINEETCDIASMNCDANGIFMYAQEKKAVFFFSPR